MQRTFILGPNQQKLWLLILFMNYFDKTTATVEIQVEILDFSVFTKRILQVILLCLLVHAGYQNNPSFNSCNANIRTPK